MSSTALPPDNVKRPAVTHTGRNWKKIALWTAAGILVIVTGLAIAIVTLLHNPSFRQYVLRIAHQRISEALGTTVQVRDFSLRLSGFSPSLDLFDVVVNGAVPYENPALLRIDHLTVGIQVVSVFQRKWYLNDIGLIHPVAHVFIDQQGNTNLPKATGGQSQTGVFDLGVRHVMVEQGEFYYNDRKSVVDADLSYLNLQASFDELEKRYSGGLSYRNGRIHLQDLNPMVHDLEAEFDATADGFNLKRGILTTGASKLTLTATLEDYVNPRVQANYQALLDSGDLRNVLNDPSLPVGVAQFAGSARYQSEQNKPLLQTVRIDGNMNSAGFQVQSGSIRAELRDLSARYLIENGNLDVGELKARVLGGDVSGSFKMRDVAQAQDSELHATVRHLGLAGIQSLMDSPALRQLTFGGAADAKIDAAWHKTLDTLTAHTDATFKGTVAPVTTPEAANTSPASVPVDGEIHAGYSAAAQQVSLVRSYLRTPQTTLNMNGTVSENATLAVQLQSNDLHELETIGRVFTTPAQPLDLYGTASFAGTVRGSTRMPQIEGQFSAASLKVRGTEWRTLRASIDASPTHLNLRNGDIQPANNRGRIMFNANLGLDDWSYKDTNPIEIDLNASQLNVVDLKNLAGVEAPVTGTLRAKVSVHGSKLNPMGQGSFSLTQATVADEPIQSADVEFEGAGDAIHATAALRMTAGSAQATLTYFPTPDSYEVELRTAGFRVDQLQTLKKRNLQIAGVLNLNAQGSGTLSDPTFKLTAQIPQFKVQDQTISGLTLQADVADHKANVSLDSQTTYAYVRGHGVVNLNGDYQADVTLDTSPISLQPIFAAYLPAQAASIKGETELHATLKGPLKDKSLVEAHITIPTFSLAYNTTIQLAAASPIQVDYTKGVLTLQKTAIRGTGTDLQLEGTIPVNGDAPISLMALGTIDLRLAQLFAPDMTSSGQIQFDIGGRGQRADPNFQGQIKIVGATFAGGGLPLGLRDGNGVLSLMNDRVEIAQFAAVVGGGTVTAKGGISYQPSLQFNLSLAGNGIRVSYPQDVHEGFDIDLAMVGSMESAVLRGQVRLNEVSFSPNFDLAGIAGQLAGSGAAPVQGFARNLQLDVAVQSTEDLSLASSKLSLQGGANIRVRGTAADPVVLGRVALDSGDVFFRGTRYLLQPSTVDFINPYKIEPRVNIAVDTTVQQYNIHLLFRGPVNQLRTSYSSEPGLPPSDIINLLVFGKTSAEDAANPTPGNLGAESMIASSVSNQLASRIEKIAGISQLSIDPVLGGNSQSPGARVTIQQRVTGNLFVTLSTDPTSTQHEVIKLEYQATPRVAVSGVRDQNGGVAVDIRIRKTW